MCKYLILKSNFNLLSLKIPDTFCVDYKIIQMVDEGELRKFLRREFQKNPDLNLTTAIPNESKTEKLFNNSDAVISLKQGDYYVVYQQTDILYVKAAGSYSEIAFRNQKNVVVTFHLADIEVKLSDGLFVRIHKSVIVNINCVTRFIGNTVYLHEQEFPIGRKFRKTLIMRLNLLGHSMALFREE